MARHASSRRRFIVKTGSAVSLGMVAGCTGGGDGGGGDGGSDDGGSGDGGGGDGGATTAAMSLEDRAKDDGALNVLSSGDLGEFIRQFGEEYGIDVNYQNTGSEDAIPQIINQVNAGNVTWDIFGTTNMAAVQPLLDNDALRRPESQDLLDATRWYEDNRVGERQLNLDLHITFNSNMVPPEEQPTTWDELTSGEYDLTTDTQEFEYAVMLKDLHGESRMKEMIRQYRDVAELFQSHSDAEEASLRGRFHGGMFKYDSVYEEGQRDLYPLEDIQSESPIIAVPPMFFLIRDSPNPNAAEFYFLHHVNNFPSYSKARFEPITYQQSIYSPIEGRDKLGENVYALDYSRKEEFGPAQEVWQNIVIEGN